MSRPRSSNPQQPQQTPAPREQRPRVSEATRAAILTAVQAGRSTRDVATEFGVSNNTVANIAKAQGHDFARHAAQKAADVASDWALARRQALLNKFFGKLEALLDNLDERPQSYQQWATAYGIAVDKRRLEDGDVTSRQEVQSTGARDRVAAKLDELAERRRLRAQAPDRAQSA